MAVPKRKVSKARRDKRRSSHWKLETPGIPAAVSLGEKTASRRVVFSSPARR